MIKNWSEAKVMVTGVCGTVGSEVLNQLIEKGCTNIVGIDHNENELFFLNQKFLDNSNVQFYLCDIEDRESLNMRMRGCDVVLHCAALKHVPLCEAAPRSAVGTNIVGIQNIIDFFDAFGADIKGKGIGRNVRYQNNFMCGISLEFLCDNHILGQDKIAADFFCFFQNAECFIFHVRLVQ